MESHNWEIIYKRSTDKEPAQQPEQDYGGIKVSTNTGATFDTDTKPRVQSSSPYDNDIPTSEQKHEPKVKLAPERSRKKKHKYDYSDSMSSYTSDTSSSDPYGYYRHLSVRLYDVLDRVGASEEFRKLRQNCAIIREIIGTLNLILTLSTFSSFIFGSSSEGTTTPGLNSDTDVLYCYDIPVVDKLREAGDGRCLLMIDDKLTQPGYVKLQWVNNGQPQTISTRDIDPDCEELDSEDRICLKHVAILGEDIGIDERNGPADTMTERNIDNVLGYRCLTIPEFAREWIGRDRPYKWPSKRMVDKMSTMGCFVVGVGHPASSEKNVEWRLSFSLQERELMFSMNAVQHKCYVILKMIKKDLIEPIVGKSVSSYHLKTCMFHVVEHTKANMWTQGNLLLCVLLCMHVLLRWVRIGYCPNYFINEENMFDRYVHRRQRLVLAEHINILLSHACGFPFLIQLDYVGELLKGGMSDVEIRSNLDETKFDKKLEVIESVLEFKTRLSDMANRHYNPIYSVNIISKCVSHTKSIKDRSEQHTQEALSCVLPSLLLQLAKSYASLSFHTQNIETNLFCLQKSGYHLREGRHCDLTTSVLLEATVFLKLEKYERCIGILEQLEMALKQKNILSVCNCYEHETIYSNIQEKQLSPLPISQIFARSPTCMVFLRSDMSITPEALHYEMFRSLDTPPGSRAEIFDDWFDLDVVDAVVYLHFLQYLAHAKLNQRFHKHVAINKLQSALNRERNLAHRETGYNLLGWIYFQEKWIKLGIKYFKKSWSIRPYHNAAKLHLMKLIRDINYQQ